MGELLAVTDRLENGYVRRVSSVHPDGENVGPGAYLYAGDRIGLVGVAVTVTICGHETNHSALVVQLHLDVPLECQASTAPVLSRGAAFATNETPAPAPALAAPIEHTIAANETIYSIARRYGVSPSRIIQENNILTPNRILAGEVLVIPGGTATAMDTLPAQVATASLPLTQGAAALPIGAPATSVGSTPRIVASATPAANGVAEPVLSGSEKFRWPVSGPIIVDFASSNGTGINIEAAEGAAVRAAENGIVIYVGSGVEGYGNLILVRHPNGYVSAYAHLKEMSVAKGAVVNRGDSIGTVGETGSVSRPQLHFELRKGTAPVDPIPLLAR